MHMVIRAIVYADDEKEAHENAKAIFERKTEGQHPFDYFTMFDDTSSEMSGPARFGKRPPVSLATSKEGKKLIEDGMKYTKESFIEALEKLRKNIEGKSNEELYIERYGEYRHNAYSVGAYQGPGIFIYDNDGEGIRDPGHLHDALNKWGTKDSRKVYVVPADVHF